MEDSQSQKLSSFHESGLYFFDDSNVVYIDPVRVLNRSYNRFRVSPSTYYPRFFESPRPNPMTTVTSSPTKRKRKRKRNAKEPRPLNDREQIAVQRHQEARPLLLKAHECLLKSIALLETLRTLRNDDGSCWKREWEGVQQSFIDLGLEAPLLEVTLNLCVPEPEPEPEPEQMTNDLLEDSPSGQCCEQMVLPAFNNLVANDTNVDAVAEILDNRYIMPRESCFYMSDLGQIRNLIPGGQVGAFYGAPATKLVHHCSCLTERHGPIILPTHADSGFNLIIVDPPWENASAHQKSRYPTLPNRYFLSLPIKQLTHTKGALVGLWVTNREKLRSFVEKELFPSWGVSFAANFYWLKVKANGSLISDLDFFHHRPYEVLILGYIPGKVNSYGNQSKFKPVKDDHVIISIPGDYSRKPPIADLLMEYVPGLKPARCIELFAREMMAGWVAWGNEPLHYQDSRYFVEI